MPLSGTVRMPHRTYWLRWTCSCSACQIHAGLLSQEERIGISSSGQYFRRAMQTPPLPLPEHLWLLFTHKYCLVRKSCKSRHAQITTRGAPIKQIYTVVHVLHMLHNVRSACTRSRRPQHSAHPSNSATYMNPFHWVNWTRFFKWFIINYRLTNVYWLSSYDQANLFKKTSQLESNLESVRSRLRSRPRSRLRSGPNDKVYTWVWTRWNE